MDGTGTSGDRQLPSLKEQFLRQLAESTAGRDGHDDRRVRRQKDRGNRGSDPPILETALGYYRRGWSLIPIKPGTKRPACQAWTPYQTTRADESRVRRWFAKGNGLAVIMGDVSDGLVCRDFDTMAGYDTWAADHPDLATTLPTVATARGRHVYFRSDHRGIETLDDGELRGAGYCLLPPSRHPDGAVYRWLIPLPDGPLPMVEDIQSAGFLSRGNVTERTECTETTQTTEDYSGEHKQLWSKVVENNQDDSNTIWEACHHDACKIKKTLWPSRRGRLEPQDQSLILKACYLARTKKSANWLWDSVEGVRIMGPNNPAGYLVTSLMNHAGMDERQFAVMLGGVTIPDNLVGDPGRQETTSCEVAVDTSATLEHVVERAILESLPTAVGKRNRQVFELARSLKAIPMLADAAASALQPHVRRWHGAGVTKGVIGTEPFEETWIDFQLAWPKVKFPKGAEPMTKVFELAKQATLPRAAQRYEQAGLRLLVALCRELQRLSGDKPFFLACRTAGGLLNVKHVTAWRWLYLLTQDGIVAEVEKGDRGRRLASRFRYLGD